MDEKERLICNDCRFLHHNHFDYNIISCEVKYEKIKKNNCVRGDYYENVAIPTRHPTVRNRDFNCKYFTKKRWYHLT